MTRPWAGPLLAAISTLVVLGVVEVGLRIAGFDPLRDFREGRALVVRASKDPEIGYELVPGASGRVWGTDVRVNAAGFRGPEPSDAQDGRRRIAVIGDSITFGNGLPAGAAYPRQLEAALVREDPRWEVLNLALGGYDTLQEIAVLERRGLPFRPERVVVGYALNDAGVISVNSYYVARLPHYRERPLLLHSRLAQLVVTRLDRREIAEFMETQADDEIFRRRYRERIDPIAADERELRALMALAPHRFPSAWYRSPERVGRIRYAFRRLGELARRHGFEVVVLIVPRLENDVAGYPHEVAHRIVAHEAARQGFAVVDPTEAFLEAGMDDLRIASDDGGHPNEAGHRILAASLRTWLLARERIREPDPLSPPSSGRPDDPASASR